MCNGAKVWSVNRIQLTLWECDMTSGLVAAILLLAAAPSGIRERG